MEQKPMQGAVPLEPPSPEVARLYLDEAQAVQERREVRIDRRVAAWRSILGALQLAVLFVAYTLVLRAGDASIQPLLVLILLSGQINAGFAERNGAQWRIHGWQWLLIGLFALAFAISFFPLVIAPAAQPLWGVFIPGSLILLSGSAVGAVQLWRARNAPRGDPRPREVMPTATRYATAALGAVLGISAASLGFDDDLAISIAMAVLLMGVAVWMFAWATDFGPQALGRFWSWHQELAFGVGMAIIIAFSLLRAFTDVVTPLVGLIGGAVSLIVLIGAALSGRPSGSAGGER